MVMNPAGFTFSDGTHLPGGSFVAAATYAMHHDKAHYENAEVFDGFRFARMRKDGATGKLQMSAPDTTYLAFGMGRHACPGVRLPLRSQVTEMLTGNYSGSSRSRSSRRCSRMFSTTMMSSSNRREYAHPASGLERRARQIQKRRYFSARERRRLASSLPMLNCPRDCVVEFSVPTNWSTT